MNLVSLILVIILFSIILFMAYYIYYLKQNYNPITYKEEYLSVKDFVKLISDGTISENVGYGEFIFEDGSEESINWDYIRCVCSSISKKYNQDCLCDIEKKYINNAFREVEEAICEWKNSEESTVNEIRWYWEDI